MSEIVEALRAKARQRRPNRQQDRAAFYLTGRTAQTQLGDVADLGLRAAPLAAYRRLEELRHDFPVILVDDPVRPVRALSAVIDDLVDLVVEQAGSDSAEQVRAVALALEQELRRRAEEGVSPLATRWSAAVAASREQLSESDDALASILAQLTTARAAGGLDGDLVACTTDSPRRIVIHAWSVVQAARVSRLATRMDRLRRGLADILDAEQANSPAGLTPDRLAHSIGTGFADELDVTALSRLLTENRPAFVLSDTRRARVRRLLTVLEDQQFVPVAGHEGYPFVYETPREAIAAHHERVSATTELAKALVIAELEIDGRYHGHTHDALFETWSVADLDADLLEMFPEYLVHCDAETLAAGDDVALLEALSDGLPIKALVCVNDLVPHRINQSASGLSARLMTGAALGDGEAFVLQVPISALAVAAGQVARGCATPGSALFTVYTGAGQWMGDLPPFIAAAAALESRVFPAYCYDPAAGPTWADRFSLRGNPQLEADWPVHSLEFADEELQRQRVELPFTAADLFAGDARFLPHLALAGDDESSGTEVPFAEHLAKGTDAWAGELPYLLMADAEEGLHRVLVDRPMLRLAGRTVGQWRRLQELGGVHSSFAARAVEVERAQWEIERAELLTARTTSGAVAVTGSVPGAAPSGAGAVPAAAAVAVEDEDDELPDERDPYLPWIETARCSTCNECTQLNNRMFAYNENRQAYVADPDAGTYAELVEAAENCQVAIIHPGKPRNPAEPGLEELLERAKPFV